jgi:hypothetical protein
LESQEFSEGTQLGLSQGIPSSAMLGCQHDHALLFEFKTYRITAMKRARTKTEDPLGAWSKEELELLKKLYPSNTAEQIAGQIGRSVWSVRRKLEVLGLRKTFRYEDRHRVVKGTKEKRCRKCRKWRRESQFYGDASNKDGLKIYCKSCDVELQREYRRRKKQPREYLRFEERHRTFRGAKQKLCNRCKQWKVETSFHKESKARDGLALSCRQCANERASERRGAGRDARKNRRYEDSHRIVKGVKQKLCTHCGKWKKENAFYKDRKARDGLSSRCKECSKTVAGERYRPKRMRLGRYFSYEERHRTVDGVREKFCRKCGSWKKESDFYNCRSAKDGLDNWCKECSYKPAGKSNKK